MLLWADSIESRNPLMKVDVRPNVATEVAKALIEGRSQLAPITREFKPEEISAFTTRWGYGPTRIAVGVDGLVVLVHKSNPLKEIRIEELDAIWTTTRLNGWTKDVQTWGDLGLSGGNWKNRPIVCINRPDGSGLRDFFNQAVTKGGKHKPSVRQTTDAMTLIEELVSNQAAIGYGSVGEVYSNLRSVPLTPVGGKSAVEATHANLASGSYPLARVIYIYFNRAPNQPIDPAIQEFLRYVLSPAGQKGVESMSLVPLQPDLVTMNLKRLEN